MPRQQLPEVLSRLSRPTRTPADRLACAPPAGATRYGNEHFNNFTLPHIIQNYPYWNRTGGKDHFFVRAAAAAFAAAAAAVATTAAAACCLLLPLFSHALPACCLHRHPPPSALLTTSRTPTC